MPKEAFGADEDPNLFNLQSIKSKQVHTTCMDDVLVEQRFKSLT